MGRIIDDGSSIFERWRFCCEKRNFLFQEGCLELGKMFILLVANFACGRNWRGGRQSVFSLGVHAGLHAWDMNEPRERSIHSNFNLREASGGTS